MQKFNQLDYLEELTQYHRLFYGVFSLGNPVFTTEIETAAVAFNESSGKVDFLLNEKFFNNLGKQERLFVLCHEALHIIFSHINRALAQGLDAKLSNIAQDIVINELLVNEFGFIRENLKFPFNPCFVDTVFDNKTIKDENIIKNGSFEYYYAKLLLNKKNLKDVNTVDEHFDESNNKKAEGSLSEYCAIPKEVAETIANQVASDLSKDELDDLIQRLESTSENRGDFSAGSVFSITIEKFKKNPWEKIVKNEIASLLKHKRKENESFLQKPRRLVNLAEDMFLPAYLEEDQKENDKFNIMFFLDSSGSCIGYKNQFFSLAKNIPEDKFNIHLYSFDTSVFKVDIKKLEVKGGGGTSFSILEKKVQSEIINNPKFNKRHPDLVFVLTDGYGNSVNPEKPEKWYWLMTTNFYTCIPEKSKIIKLNDFRFGNVKPIFKNK